MKTDSQLQRDVLDELASEPSVNAAHIGVAVENGIVTLSGHVPSYPERRAAEEAAKRVHGVKAVVDELEVKLPDSRKRTDEDLAAAVIHAFETYAAVPTDRIKVTVSRGWVTLEGEVEEWRQKDAAERAVLHLPGVVGVSSRITVKPRVAP